MLGKLNDKNAKCPYFREHTTEVICCEGPIPDTTVRTSFPTADAKKTQYRVFCCKQFRNCEMYQAIERKYEED